MSYTQCSVCGKKVDANKNMIAKHEDKKGNMCYGSFTPVQNFDPFHVKRSVPLLQPLHGPDDNWHPIGGNQPLAAEPGFGILDDYADDYDPPIANN